MFPLVKNQDTTCIINPPCWLEQLYYFVHLRFLSFSPTPTTCPNTKHLYFSSLSMDTKPDRATSCPLSWASMPVRLILVNLFVFSFLFYICQSTITVYIYYVHNYTLSGGFLNSIEMILSYLECCEVVEQSLKTCCLPLRELAVISCPFITSVVL